MIIKKWFLIGLVPVLVLSLLPGCACPSEEPPPFPTPPVPAPPTPLPPSPPTPSPPTPAPPEVPPASESYVGSVDELIGFWEGKVQLKDLDDTDRTVAIEKALRDEGIQSISSALEEEGYRLNRQQAEVIQVNFDVPEQPEVIIVSIPSQTGPGNSKATAIIALPDKGNPFSMGFITNIGVVRSDGSVVIHPSFFVRAVYWIDGRLIWWHYWWHDSDNHPNWYYSWWYWRWGYYWDHGYSWYPWHTWFYSWFYWRYWWYWSTWWAF